MGKEIKVVGEIKLLGHAFKLYEKILDGRLSEET